MQSPCKHPGCLTERLDGSYPWGLVWSLGRAELHATGLLLCNTLAHIIRTTHHSRTAETRTAANDACWNIKYICLIEGWWRLLMYDENWARTATQRAGYTLPNSVTLSESSMMELHECRRARSHANKHTRACAHRHLHVHTQVHYKTQT